MLGGTLTRCINASRSDLITHDRRTVWMDSLSTDDLFRNPIPSGGYHDDGFLERTTMQDDYDDQKIAYASDVNDCVDYLWSTLVNMSDERWYRI